VNGRGRVGERAPTVIGTGSTVRTAPRARPYAGRVQETWTLVVAGTLGMFTGAFAVLAFRFSEREQRREGAASAAPAVSGDVAAVLDSVRAIAIILGPEEEVIRANPAAYAFGLVRGGRLVHRVTQDVVQAVRRDGVTRDREIDVPRGPGESPGLHFLRLRAAGLPGDRVLLLADDETAARRLEEVRRDFVANVSHELKTPVGAVALLAETVIEAADDPDAVRRFTGQLQREARRLTALVQEIIDLSRLQGPNPLMEIVPVPVDELVAEAVDRARVEAQARKVDLVVGGTEGLVVMGDHALLVTALRNLVDNAVRYSDAGTRVGIGVELRGGFVEIAVVDEGIGIAPEDLGRIFERFYRVDPARSRQTGGTGLGLSIVKHVAADHGGEVTVWSTPGRGSTFTLRLPQAEVGEPGAPAPQATEGVRG
jgi:two-component system sensor histidine kinase SenX3